MTMEGKRQVIRSAVAKTDRGMIWAIVIDSQITPAAARALVADLKAVTTKPVRYVVDSHYHYDHSFGNQVFPSDVQVIGHDNTRRRLLTNVMEQDTFLTSVRPVPARVEALKQRIAQEADPAQKAALGIS